MTLIEDEQANLDEIFDSCADQNDDESMVPVIIYPLGDVKSPQFT